MSLNDAQPMSQRCTGLLGAAVVDLWGDLPHDVQQALFEQALRQDGGEGAEGPPMREELAKFLHDHHARTLQQTAVA
ncbi:MAG: hypothetical protein JWN71_1478 [Xanthobacteraceae bacterium]|nr:hypothetical protein [Xanthobacteraceae bacterium]